MDKLFMPPELWEFADELHELCKKYKITELVALAEYDKRFTTVLQISQSNGAHASFNNLKTALQKLMEDLQKQKAKSK